MKVYFDPTATRAFTAKILQRFVGGPLVFIALGAVILPVMIQEIRAQNVSHIVVAICTIVFTVIVIQKFIKDVLENDTRKPLSKNNAACLLSFDILSKMPSKTDSAKDILKALLQTQRAHFILQEMGVDEQHVLSTVIPQIGTEDIVSFLNEAASNMEKFHTHRIDAGVILYTIFQRKGPSEELLNLLDLSLTDLKMIIRWEQYHHAMWHHQKWWSPGGLVRTFSGVGQGWMKGYNDALDDITTDISQNILYTASRKVTIHLDQIKDALHILGRKSQHNIIVTGQDGCGKEAFIQNVAYQLRLAESRNRFQYTHVLRLQSEDLLSGGKNPDTFMLDALKRAEAQGRYILVIENIGLFLQSGDANVRSVLGKFLQSKQINIIGIADTKDYHALIKTDIALDAQFEKIMLEPTSFADTMSVLMEEYFTIRDVTHVQVTYKALKAMVDLADRYIQKGAFPGKAMNVLHDSIAYAKEHKTEFITEAMVRKMVSLRAKMDISEKSTQQIHALQNLETQMHTAIVGQDHAISAVSNALKRAGVDIANSKKPLGTFLFLGPTGVGKTQTAKVLAEKYFGSEDAMIRLDMNEYSAQDSVQAIIGSSDPSNPSEGFLTKQVQDKPFSLVLLDEIEKADKKVLNLFLQILDEGHLIDAQGVKTNFRNTIIIATSNAGATFIADFIQNNTNPHKEDFKKALIEELIHTGSYSPEFLNRFDDVVLYYPLTKEQTIEVARRMIGSMTQSLQQEKGIAIIVEKDAIAAIAEKGYSPEFGAREMRRTITDTLENYIADQLLQGDVKRGSTLSVSREDLNL